METLKLIAEVINPYVVNKRKELGLASTQKALVIWDVFKGQMTDAVKSKLASLHMELVPVPANMTHFFQPLDLTVNGVAKKFAKKEFATHYSSILKQQLESGKHLEDIEVDLRLSVIKPLHAQWLVNMYNFFTQPDGRKIVLKGWQKAGISGLLDGTTVLPPEDPFETIPYGRKYLRGIYFCEFAFIKKSQILNSQIIIIINLTCCVRIFRVVNLSSTIQHLSYNRGPLVFVNMMTSDAAVYLVF